MAVTGVLKKCADCGTVFVAENPAPPVGMDTESRPRMP